MHRLHHVVGRTASSKRDVAEEPRGRLGRQVVRREYQSGATALTRMRGAR